MRPKTNWVLGGVQRILIVLVRGTAVSMATVMEEVGALHLLIKFKSIKILVTVKWQKKSVKETEIVKV